MIVNIDEIKLACTSRLALVRLVLKGIPFRLLERVHFYYSFRTGNGLLPRPRSMRSGSNVLREGEPSRFISRLLEKLHAYLFWR